MTGAKSGAALRRCSGEGRWRREAPEAAGTKERRGGEPRALRRGAAKWAPSGQMARAGWLAAMARRHGSLWLAGASWRGADMSGEGGDFVRRRGSENF